MLEKLKSFVADDRFFMSAALVLVAALAFLLGRMSVGDVIEKRGFSAAVPLAPVVMTYNSKAATTTETKAETVKKTAPVAAKSEVKYVASKSGSKYHHPDCSGAKRIKEENRVYFSSESEARAAGYAPAANCSQLSN